ncbi:hypothetical protein AB0442_38475 [Kitasatospora sp. NPDC085895]|uniref:hypothetical protein n=1 Tax=Kitasatospora sp. NPDC085895 TaxID=3155057 RepID=UPI00344E5E4D
MRPSQTPPGTEAPPAQAVLALVEQDPEGAGRAVIGTDPRAAAIVAVRLDAGAAVAAVAALGEALPDPASLPEVAEDDDSELTAEQQELREACDRAIQAVQGAADASVWTIGRALDVVARQRLHRRTHPTLDTYAQELLGRRYRQTKRWRDGWPLAAVAAEMCPIGHIAPNEGQMRELLKVEGRHGRQAAAQLYGAVLEEANRAKIRTTAVLLATARDALPERLPADDQQTAVREAAAQAVEAACTAAAGQREQQERGTGSSGSEHPEVAALRAAVGRLSSVRSALLLNAGKAVELDPEATGLVWEAFELASKIGADLIGLTGQDAR